jgi:hypothetical protein
MEPFNFKHLDVETNQAKYMFPQDLPNRPTALNKDGKAVQVRVNQFKVIEWPQKTVYQYDVSSSELHSGITLNIVNIGLHR